MCKANCRLRFDPNGSERWEQNSLLAIPVWHAACTNSYAWQKVLRGAWIYLLHLKRASTRIYGGLVHHSLQLREAVFRTFYTLAGKKELRMCGVRCVETFLLADFAERRVPKFRTR